MSNRRFKKGGQVAKSSFLAKSVQKNIKTDVKKMRLAFLSIALVILNGFKV